VLISVGSVQSGNVCSSQTLPLGFRPAPHLASSDQCETSALPSANGGGAATGARPSLRGTPVQRVQGGLESAMDGPQRCSSPAFAGLRSKPSVVVTSTSRCDTGLSSTCGTGRLTRGRDDHESTSRATRRDDHVERRGLMPTAYERRADAQATPRRSRSRARGP
jgi:hypothetical protein